MADVHEFHNFVLQAVAGSSVCDRAGVSAITNAVDRCRADLQQLSKVIRNVGYAPVALAAGAQSGSAPKRGRVAALDSRERPPAAFDAGQATPQQR